jgi:nucleotide-binding universal stress UspA family protein
MGEELEYGFIMPLFPLFPVVALICQAVLAFFLHEMSLMAWVIAPSWLALGLVLYLVYGKKRSVVTEEEIHTLHEEGLEERPEGTGVLLPIANPKSAPLLSEMVNILYREEKAVIDLLHMVPVPDQLALEDAGKYVSAGQEGLEKAESLLEKHHSVTKTVRYCRNIARGIFSTARERRSQMLILGWHGKRTSHLFQIGSTIDPVICRAPCNVTIFKMDPAEKTRRFRNILVPLFGNVNDALSMVIAQRFIIAKGGSITALYFNRMRMRPGHIHNILNRIVDREKVHLNEIASDANDHVDEVLREAADHDLIIMGIREPRLYRLGRSSASERIVERSDKPFILVKATSNITGWFRRIF